MDLTPTNDRSLKSFWERKEGTVGMVTLGLLGLAGLFAAKALLPTIIDVLTMGTIAIGQLWMGVGLLTGLAFTLWVLFCTNVPKLFMYYFKANVRRATGVFVSVYPIEIMQEFISKMIGKKQIFNEKKTDIKKQKKIVEDTISENERRRKAALNTMQAAKNRGMQNEVTLAARQAGMLEDVNKRHTATLTTLETLCDRLDRVEQVCDFRIRDMQFQVELLEQEHNVSKATKGVLAAGRAILMGADPDQELYDMATEFVVDDFRATMGDVDSFMDDIESTLNGFDLQNGMWEERALEQLARLEQTEQKLIGRAPQGQVVTPVITAPAIEAIPLPSTDYASKYLKS